MRATIDIETTYGEEYGRVGNPFSDKFGLCSAGLYSDGRYTDIYTVVENDGETNIGIVRRDISSFPFDLTGVTFLCGHNITFDLLWFWHTPELRAWLKVGGRIWDTAYAEYLLSGQLYYLGHPDPKYGVSLRATAKRRLGIDDQKLDVVSEMWEQGIRTEDIPKTVLLEYNKQDIIITDKIAEQQMKEAQERGMVQNILDRMDSMLATIEMTFNGILVDMDVAEKNRELLLKDIAYAEVKLRECLNKYDVPKELEFNWGSGSQKAAYLFGGSIKYEVREQKKDEEGNLLFCNKKEDRPILDEEGNQVYYKSGKNAGMPKTKKCDVPDYDRPKMHTVDYFFELPGVVPEEDRDPAWKTDKGSWSTKEEFLKELGLVCDLPEVNLLLDYAGMTKDLSTYYWKESREGKKSGMLTMVNPDGKIHPHLNHNVTATTRLSSSKPNFQNISSGNEDDGGEFEGKSRIKEAFVSRFGADGRKLEIDYSQLEVVCKAVLSECPALANAILSGVDEHCEWAAFAFGADYEDVVKAVKKDHDPLWTKRRKQIKAVTFGEKYGAGAPKLAKQSKLPIEVIKAAMEARQQAYPRMYAFDDDVLAEVEATRIMSPFTTPKGFPAGVGYYVCATNTIYSFIEQDAPAWKAEKFGTLTGFKPTTTKNYPSQGLGGLITQVACGRIYRWLLANDFFGGRAVLENTVHDCIWLDTHKDVTDIVALGCKLIMEDTRAYFNKKYKTSWKLDFPVEIEAGPDMLHLSAYTPAKDCALSMSPDVVPPIVYN